MKNQIIINSVYLYTTLKTVTCDGLMKDNSKEIKEKIIKNLEKHPEGLTIEELSQLIKAHRQTITKYIFELTGNGTVLRRWVGPASLHYLKKIFGEVKK